MKLIRVGENVEGFDYPVVNERSIRATAGLMLLVGIITLFLVKSYGYYDAIKFTVGLFFIEFGLKTIIGPHASIFDKLGSFIVRKQEPEYIGAIQKKFAWGLGLAMALSMVFIVGAYELRGIVPMSICMFCLALMWLESAFGICVGCKIYWGLVKVGWLNEPKVRPKCAGGVCRV